MKCLECKKPANEVAIIDGVAIGECDDGHRTGKLSLKQEKEIIVRLGFDLSEGVTVSAKGKGKKAAKRAVVTIPAPMGEVLDDAANEG